MELEEEMMPYSPSADSSPSSSDLDTESTGSFFPDRSTTLGTLMGVSAFGGQRRSTTRAAPGEVVDGPARAAPAEEEEGRRARRRRRRPRGASWWRLCRDDAGGPPTRLGEFLDMERQLAGSDFLCDGGVGGAQVVPEAATVAATALFEDGRVRPPQPQQQQRAAPPEERGRWRLQRAVEGSSSSLGRLPVLLTGICSGGAG